MAKTKQSHKIAWQFPKVPESGSLCALAPARLHGRAGRRAPLNLLLSAVLLFALATTAFVRSDSVHAEANSGETGGGPGPGDIGSVQLRLESGLLTLHAVETPLQEVLTEVGTLAGMEILLRSDLDISVTTSISKQPLDEAIARLLDGTDFVMLYLETEGAGGPSLRLEITVHGYSAGPTAALAGSGDAQEATVGDLEIDQSIDAVIARRAVALGLEPTVGDLYEDLARLETDERVHAMRWLADLDDEAAVETLGRFLALDKDPAVRGEAALALSDIGGAAASQALTFGLGDSDPDVRYQVVEAIGAVAGDRGTMLLGQVLYGETDPEIRISAIASLGGLPGDAARVFLESAAQDPHPRVREIAEDALMFRD